MKNRNFSKSKIPRLLKLWPKFRKLWKLLGRGKLKLRGSPRSCRLRRRKFWPRKKPFRRSCLRFNPWSKKPRNLSKASAPKISINWPPCLNHLKRLSMSWKFWWKCLGNPMLNGMRLRTSYEIDLSSTIF